MGPPEWAEDNGFRAEKDGLSFYDHLGRLGRCTAITLAMATMGAWSSEVCITARCYRRLNFGSLFR